MNRENRFALPTLLRALTDAELHDLLVAVQTELRNRPAKQGGLVVEVLTPEEAALVRRFRRMPPTQRADPARRAAPRVTPRRSSATTNGQPSGPSRRCVHPPTAPREKGTAAVHPGHGLLYSLHDEPLSNIPTSLLLQPAAATATPARPSTGQHRPGAGLAASLQAALAECGEYDASRIGAAMLHDECQAAGSSYPSLTIPWYTSSYVLYGGGMMTQEYPAIDISHDPELMKLTEEVRRSQRAKTVRLADDVVAVVKPEKRRVGSKPKQRLPAGERGLPTTYTLESALGSVPIPPHLKGHDLEEVIEQAKEEHAGRIMRE